MNMKRCFALRRRIGATGRCIASFFCFWVRSCRTGATKKFSMSAAARARFFDGWEIRKRMSESISRQKRFRFAGSAGLNNVRQGDIHALAFSDASFDAVICSSVLYHQWVTDLDSALREMRRVLRPGGLLLINVPPFRFLHSVHDKAVMTARRFRKSEIRKLLLNQNFTIQRLTYWTTLLFPLAVAARTLGGSEMGRDFETEEPSLLQRVFAQIMAGELRLLRRISFPFGVALLAVARK